MRVALAGEVAASRLLFDLFSLVLNQRLLPFDNAVSQERCAYVSCMAEQRNIMIVNHRQALTGTCLLHMLANAPARE